MPVLRSRDIPSHQKSTPPPTTTVGQPPTPAKTAESLSPSLTPSRRRSLRLSPDAAGPTPNRRHNDAVLNANGDGNASVNFTQLDGSYGGNDCVSDRARVRVSDVENVKLLGQIDGIKEEVVENGVLSLRSGTRVLKRVSIGGGEEDENYSDCVRVSDVDLDKVVENVKPLGQIDAIKEEIVENGVLSLRSGTRVLKRVSISGGEKDGSDNDSDSDSVGVSDIDLDKVVDNVKRLGQIDGIKEEVVENEILSVRSGTRVSKRVSIGSDEEDESKKKIRRLSVGDSVQENDGLSAVKVEEGLRSPKRYTREEKGKCVLSNGDLGSLRRYTREEKGKGVDYVLIDENENVSVDDDDIDVNLELGLYLSRESLNVDVEPDQGVNLRDEIDRGVSDGKMDDQLSRVKYMKDKHKNIARLNAHKYAHFSIDDDEGLLRPQVDGQVVLDGEGGNEMEVPEEDNRVPNVEDWPGPFSTAMKIIRDREKNLGKQARNSGSGEGGMPLISWTPRKERGSDWKRLRVPSLESMSLKVLSENVDAIGSLNYVPDVLRHRLCQMLCDSRRMNAHFFSLLLQGSPSEIRVADCSWLEEEEFESSIKGCDTSKLTVLQLDLSGHCISDASLLKAVAPKGLPVLTTISLKGACRISDAGLNVIVSAAPVLRSLNLSQCSLLTDVGIKTIADSLGSIVHELYLDDCDTLNAMNILPSLQRLVQLEVLSLRGISSVSDKFIKKLSTSNGQNIKELVLANCVNLTDSSLKVIAETCSQLCVLDLSYLRKLTDIGMAHLANGCHGIQDLRLCRNAFSDDAIAAFFETSGESLKELSLNNVIKVGQNTTISLARRCKNLESLDLSWCRALTDDALGLIADSCSSLRLLKIFGCTQITKTFIDGHSNPHLHVVGMKLTPILENIKRPDFQQGPLYYSAVPSF